MKKHAVGVVFIVSCVLALAFCLPVSSFAQKRIVFGGGPAGGTFQVVANSIQIYDPVKQLKGYNIKAQSSAGSVENLRKVDARKSDFGVVYAGNLYQGMHGQLKNDTHKYTNVRAVSFLYGAPAQLVVNPNLGINSVKDLVGKKVGVGNAGSGAFANCELFFAHLGIWDKVERNAMGYNEAAAAFGNNQLDAFWVFTTFPSASVIMAAQTSDIKLLDLQKEGKETGFFKKNPYFSMITIPAGTYRDMEEDAPSFQDSALWVANKDVPDDLVYDLLSLIFSEEGLKHMVSQKKVFKQMSVENGVSGISTPLHPGAEKFWKEKGVLK